MMREVCLIKAEEENFLQIVGTYSSTAHSQSPCTSRRLVLQSPTTINFQRDIKNPKLRSLAIVRNFQRGWMLSDISFTRLQLLRLLDISGAEFEGTKLHSSIGKLIHLRYLSLEGATVSHLPSSLENLTLLIYLNLDVDVVNVFVPNVFMGMQELRYLALPRYKLHTTELRLSKLANLETLKHFSTANCSLGDLHGMPRLRTLSILVNGETNVENLSASIAALRDLENLNIEDLGYKRSLVTEECCSDEKQKSKRLMEEGIVLDFNYLNKLELSIYMPRFPDEQHFPSRLTSLALLECRLEDDPMPILEKLLQLKELSLCLRSFCGRRMVCADGGLPRLHKLLLSGLLDLEEWIIEEVSMPLLHTLTIGNCQKLKQLPDGLRFICSLEKLYMDKEWKERLLKGGNEYYKVQHISSVIFSYE